MVFGRKMIVLIAVVLVLGGCSGRKGNSSSGSYSSEVRERAQAYFKSGKEPTVKDALWTSDTMFKVGVLDDSTTRDGFAQYVCEVLRSDFGITGVRVKVVDVALLVRTGEWKDLGYADCH